MAWRVIRRNYETSVKRGLDHRGRAGRPAGAADHDDRL